MKIKPRDFRLAGREKIRLKRMATDIRRFYRSEKHYKELLAADVGELSALQRLLDASSVYSVLIIFQGMDAAGKDGAIATSLAASTRRAARSTASSSRAPRSWSMTFSGGLRAGSRREAASASSTDPT